MGSNSFYGKKTSIRFVVKNTAPGKKRINVFNIGIPFDTERDLMGYPEVSESMIKESLVKGELANKIRVGHLVITDTNIDLTTFDDEQKQFLIDAGCNLGYDPSKAAKDAGVPYIELGPLEDEPPPTSFFFDVDGTPSYTDSEGSPHAIGSGGGGGPYPYIQFDDENDFEGNPNNSISAGIGGALAFKNAVGTTRIVQYADGSINPPYIAMQGHDNEGIPGGTLFANSSAEGSPLSFKTFDNEIINLEAGGGVDTNALDARYVKYHNVVVLDSSTPTVNLGPSKYQAVVNPVVAEITVNVPVGEANGDIIDIKVLSGATEVVVTGPDSLDVTVTSEDPVRLTWQDDHYLVDFVSDREVDGAMTGDAVIEGLVHAQDSVKLNYNYLHEVQHPITESGIILDYAATAGWSKAALLNSFDISIYGANNTDNDPTSELGQKPYQAIAQLNRENWISVSLPQSPLPGDIVDVYVPEGASCIEIQGKGLWGAPAAFRFRYNGDDWDRIDFASEQEFFIEVNRRAIREASNIYLDGMNFAVEEINGQRSSLINGNTICLGNINVMSDTIIYGDLIVMNQIINHGGYSLTVHGNLVADSIDFIPEANGEGQGNLEVRGDLITKNNIQFPVERFTAEAESFYPSMYIGGDLIVGGSVEGSGYVSAPGLYVEVGGNARFTNMNLSGGDSGESFGPWNGNELWVGGDLFCEDFRANGGNNFGSGDGSDFAGHGGYITVSGSVFSGTFELTGGDAPVPDISTGSAGNGGQVNFKGDAKTYYIDVRGGDCFSNNPSHVAGNAGYVNVGGDLSIGNTNTLWANGGTRSGSLTGADGVVQSAYGGEIEVLGNIIARNAGINFSGGNIETTNATPGQAGDGGQLRVYGDFICSSVLGEGGDCSLGHGGEGGGITVYGNLTFGDSESANLSFLGGDGNYLADAAKIGQGGGGGRIDIRGNVDVYQILTIGGIGNRASGGHGGDITCGKVLKANSISTCGGNATSDIPTSPGSGGEIEVQLGIVVNDSIDTYAGVVDGTITSPTVSEYGNDGGRVRCRFGNIHVGNANLNGGSLSTSHHIGNGGQGGQMIANRGTICCTGTISSSGGNSNGGDGGHGGEIWALTVELNSVIINGGSSVPAPADDTQGTKGSGGALSMGNGRAVTVTIKDGVQGSAASNEMGIWAGGFSSIEVADLEDRADSFVKPYDSIPATLVITNMPTKQTLNKLDGTPTVNVNANLGDSIFKFDGTRWYKIVGESLDVP